MVSLLASLIAGLQVAGHQGQRVLDCTSAPPHVGLCIVCPHDTCTCSIK